MLSMVWRWFVDPRHPNRTLSMVWRPQGAQTLCTVSFRDQKAPKRYPHRNVDDSRRPKPLPGGETKKKKPKVFFFCRAPPDWGLFCEARQAVTTAPKPCARCAWLTQGAQALRSVWFGDLKAPKSYAHYNLETPRPPNLMHTVV